MSDIFISYQRKSQDFVKYLHQHLTASGKDIWVDLEDIPKATNWWQEIQRGIEAATAFVFVITPDSVISEVCTQEVAHALALNKKILPIVLEIDPKTVPSTLADLAWGEQALKNWTALKAINWIYFHEGGFDAAFAELIAAYETDLDLERFRARLTVRSVEWEQNKRNTSFLLRGTDLTNAEQWLEDAANTKQPATSQHISYISASRKASNARQRVTIGSLAGGILVALTLAIVALIFGQLAQVNERLAVANAQTATNAQGAALNNASTAVVERDRANRQAAIALSRQLAAQSSSLLTSQLDLSQLLSVKALQVLPDNIDQQFSYEARDALIKSITHSPALIRYLHGQEGRVNALAFDRGNRYLLASSCKSFDDRDYCLGSELRLWRVADGKLIKLLWENTIGEIGTATFSADGKFIVAGGCKGMSGGFCSAAEIRVWNVDTSELVDQFDTNTSELYSLHFDPQNRVLAGTSCIERTQSLSAIMCMGRFETAVWSWPEHRLLARLDDSFDEALDEIAVSTDGQLIAFRRREDVSLWLLSNQQTALTQLKGAGPLVFSNDGRQLQFDATQVWNITTQQATSGTLPEAVQIGSPAQSDKAVESITGSSNRFSSTAFSPDGRLLATGATNQVLIWAAKPDYALGQNLNAQSAPTVGLNSVVLNGKTTYSLRMDSGTGISNILVTGVTTDEVIALSSNGTYLATTDVQGDSFGNLILWTLTGAQPSKQVLATDLVFVSESSFSPDSSILAVSSCFQMMGNGGCRQGQLRLWNTSTGTQIGSALMPQGDRGDNIFNFDPSSLAFSPDGIYIALGGCGDISLATCIQDKIELWNVATGESLGQILALGNPSPDTSSITDIAFNHDGTRLGVVYGDQRVDLFEVPGLKQAGSLTVPGGRLDTLSFSPNGNFLATSGKDNVIRLWSIADGKINNPPLNIPSTGTDVRFAANSDHLLFSRCTTYDEQQTCIHSNLIYFPITLTGWVEMACRVANRNLSAEERVQYINVDDHQDACDSFAAAPINPVPEITDTPQQGSVPTSIPTVSIEKVNTALPTAPIKVAVVTATPVPPTDAPIPTTVPTSTATLVPTVFKSITTSVCASDAAKSGVTDSPALFRNGWRADYNPANPSFPPHCPPGYWTRPTADTQVLDTIEYSFIPAVTADYEISAYIPSLYNSPLYNTGHAPYTITHAAGSSTVYVDQQTNLGKEVILGVYRLNANTRYSVTLTNYTGETKNRANISVSTDTITWRSLRP